MTSPVCLITGATEGVGKATAVELARKGFTVVMAARNAAKAEEVKWEITKSTGNADADYIVGDLSSLRQVHQLAETFKQRYAHLDVLLNNAGIFSPRRNVTEDGFEETYQVNYLSHFLLTHLLLDALRKSDQGRIINLTSNIYGMGRFDQNIAKATTRFSTMGTYATSKLLMLMFTVELANRLRGTAITINAVHPGVVKTHMLTSATGVFKLVSYLARPFAVSPQVGAATSVYLASSLDVTNVTGQYFTNCKSTATKSKFNTEENRTLLWNHSMDCLQRYGLSR
jgi:retinol dehydrogenase-12